MSRLEIDEFGDGPFVLKVLANQSGFATWKGLLKNYDTDNKGIEVLIQIHVDEEILRVATRPENSGASWSPPVEFNRS